MNMSNGKNQTGSGPGPRAPTPSAIAAQTTCNLALNTQLSKEDIVSQEKAVKDANGGAAYLEKSLLCLVGQPLTIEHLVHVLFQIMQIKSVPLPAVEAIRAVAFLLEREAITQTAEVVAAQIHTTISQEITQQVITALAPHIAKLLTTNESLNTTINSLDAIHSKAADTLNEEAMSSAIKCLTSAVDMVVTESTVVKDTIDPLTPSLVAMQDFIKSLLSATADLNLNPTMNQLLQKTYSDALWTPAPFSSSIPTPTTTVLARAAIRDCQILIDPHKGHTLHSPDQSTSSIADKLKSILDEIKGDEAPALIVKALV